MVLDTLEEQKITGVHVYVIYTFYALFNDIIHCKRKQM